MTAHPAAPPALVPKRELLGVPFAITDYEQAMDVMDGMIERRERGYLCAAAVHVLMVGRHDPATREALLGASLVVPDGRPLVWALNLLGESLTDRVYGPELTVRYCSRAAERGHRVWLYGGATPAALEELERALRARFPEIRIVGGLSPPHRALTDAEERELARRIDADSPDIVWVGVGAPRQELWMARMRPLVDLRYNPAFVAAFARQYARERRSR
jgi:N-acetylglucosaminyldiphosphoundecaprenol N-acetyl-beta-D-mannosaminyltransferase